MEKEAFLEKLRHLDKEDIDKLIKEKGKPIKPVNPFIDLSIFEPYNDNSVNSRKQKS